MLSEQTRSIVKATVPVLEQHGVTITKTFYSNMFHDHPSLLNIFNRVNQSQGRQQTALATTVLAAAKHIDDLSVLLPHVKQIGHKHRALQIQPAQYAIVGEYLLKAIKEVLGDAATPSIIDAWTEAYNVIAGVFIGVEKDMYKEAAWEGWEQFEVTNREQVADEILQFTVKPVKGSIVDLSKIPIVPGQYITVNTHPLEQGNTYDALRHYSICSSSFQDGLKFAVKFEHANGHNGLVSEYLHKDVNIGDTIKISAPAGDFSLNQDLIHQNEIPLVLLASGVGATPLLCMLESQLLQNPKRPIVWIQSSFSESQQAFHNILGSLLDKGENVTKHIVYTNTMEQINGDFLSKNVPAHSDVYICGSINFMQGMTDFLSILEHKDDMIHYEPFGPKMSTVSV